MDDLSRLVAIEEIKTLKARYFRGVDTKDWVLLDDVMAEDIVVDYRGTATDPGTGINYAPDATGDTIQGRALVIDGLKKSLDGIVSAHQGYMPEIEILSDTEARGVWAMFDALRFPAGAPISALSGFGHYHETYQKIDGRWRIKTLRLPRLRVDVVPVA
ncbi:MAG: nuclear transport factor 2 family protein [Sphingomonadaceae bacterium]